MHIARVIGTVVATARHPVYDGHKLLVVRSEAGFTNAEVIAYLRNILEATTSS